MNIRALEVLALGGLLLGCRNAPPAGPRVAIETELVEQVCRGTLELLAARCPEAPRIRKLLEAPRHPLSKWRRQRPRGT